MDRMTSETYTGTRLHFKSEEDYYEYLANTQPEPEETEEIEAEEPEAVPAELLSACCAAGFRYEQYSFGIDQETGYHDDGERCVCLACGSETEPEVLAVNNRKPVTRQQGELFEQGVA